MSEEELLTDEMLEVGRKAIEDILIEFRDSRISLPFRNNGLVVKEYDGKDSSIIRLGPEDAIRIGVEAIFAEYRRRESASQAAKEGEG